MTLSLLAIGLIVGTIAGFLLAYTLIARIINSVLIDHNFINEVSKHPVTGRDINPMSI